MAATLSLAGIGPQKTKLKVVADPDAPGNVHQIEAKGDFGVMRFTFENRPHPDNPRTSYLAILSAIELLRQACSTGLSHRDVGFPLSQWILSYQKEARQVPSFKGRGQDGSQD